VDIVITRDSFQTLADVVIIDPTRPNLVQHVFTTITHAMIVVTQDKAQSYTKRMPGDDFIPLTIEIYDCFHHHFDSFFTSCVHACMTCHHQTSLLPLMLIFHYRQRVLIALQCVQAITIPQRAGMLSYSSSFLSSSLPHRPATAPPSLADLWQRMPF